MNIIQCFIERTVIKDNVFDYFPIMYLLYCVISSSSNSTITIIKRHL